ncbi:MAG: hypothetical protein A2W89_24215 [Bacteroidetes bacterium GWE2_42_39]|nr:MAG: hypothetical protein A2W92_01850 [Bacteroidetes bacterium GWA2_42_15]OFY02863.1 MAG: hypothetical protein A2W89_24215 [Bacteroidetes bacterium GWE2_42_39]
MRKILITMKLSLVIILFSLFSAGASVYCQNSKLNLDYKNVSLKEVLGAIEDQSEFRFAFSSEYLDLDRKVSVRFENESVVTILDNIFKETDIRYSVKERMIILYKDEVVGNKVIQQKTVTGKVTDSSGAPLPGVSVVVKGTTTGTITDFDGNYTLANVPGNAILQFLFVGMKKEEISVEGKTVINVVLQEETIGVEEVVVTAMNINRNKQSLGYSLTALSGEDVGQAKETSVVNSLKGKVAGLSISQTAGGVGGSSRVILRGISSLTSSNTPLFVIDGVAMGDGQNSGGGASGKDMGNAMSEIDPENIESISVLKGAGASAAYGSRGANGVILITTKKGRKNGFGITFTSNYDMDIPVLYTKLQNIYGQGIMGMYPPIDPVTNMPAKSNIWALSFGPKMEGQMLPNFAGKETAFSPQPNNVLDYFRTGSTFTNSITLDSGNEKANVLLGFSNVDSKGVSPGNELSRQSFNMRGAMKIGSHIDIDSKISYIHQKVDNRVYMQETAGNAMWMLTVMPRNMRLADLRDNTIDANGNELKFQDEAASTNPYWTLNNLKNNDEKHHLVSFVSAKIELAKWLNLKVQSGMDFNNLKTQEHFASGSSEPRLNIAGGLSNGLFNNLEWNSDFMFSTKKEFSKKISTELNFGGNNRYVTSSSITNSGIGLKAPDFYSISNVKSYSTGTGFSEKTVRSLYSLGSLSYDQWFYFDLSLRNDWSSALPENNNSYFYHSENISLLFTKALGIKSDILSNGRLRGSYGKVGNDTGPYQTNQYYGFVQSNYPYPLGSVGSLAPTDLKPELTSSWEVGTNLGLLKSRVELDFTYYNSKTTNQIMNVDIPNTSGYSSRLLNAGEVKNMGMEMLVNASLIQNDQGLNWDLSINAAKNYSEVVSLYQGLEKIDLGGFFTGLQIEARPGEPFGVIYGNSYLRDSFGDRYIDDTGFPMKGEIKKLGDINPDLAGGISNKFSYKKISFSFLVDFQLGGEFISGSKFYQYTMGTHVNTLPGREEWYSTHGADGTSPIPGVQEDGPVFTGINYNTGETNTIPVLPAKYYSTPFTSSISEDFVLDATNVRLREIVLSYSLPKKIMNFASLKSVSLSLVGRNLGFFYRANDYADPESGYSSGNIGTGREHSPIPTTRFIGMQLKVEF